ncbi:unnamed protein product [Sympodiomycopsis kandeliae]
MTSFIATSCRGHLRKLSLGGRSFSSVPPSSPSSSRVRITYTSPITSSSHAHNASTVKMTSSPAMTASSSAATKSSYAHAGSSSSSSGKKPKRFRIDPSSPPPKSGWCSRVYPICLGVGLGTGMTVWSMVQDRIKMEGGNPQYNLDQVTLIALVGYPGSGKSTQADKLVKEFKGFQIVSQSNEQSIKEAISKSSSGGPTLLISDNYPTTLPEAQHLESTICPIFVILYFDIPEKDWLNRTKGTSPKQYQEEQKRLEPMIKHFRNRGNILEISADWNDPSEVWEQVQAKVEQVLELKEMGEDVSLS